MNTKIASELRMIANNLIGTHYTKNNISSLVDLYNAGDEGAFSKELKQVTAKQLVWFLDACFNEGIKIDSKMIDRLERYS